MSEGRLAVSSSGMRELHAGRSPWSLVKELVQNSWDEAPEATVCEVEIGPGSGPGKTLISVTDDGPGFSNIADAYTLMGASSKRASPIKRGRFNLGEKELIAVALEATIQTVGHTIHFPAEGGRQERRNRSKRGTIVHLTMPWKKAQRGELIERLKRFRPTECRLVINGEEVERREPILTQKATLQTVLQNGVGEPMRMTRRSTNIDILARVANEAWIYEMGIPVQSIDGQYDLDIQQKIPMPPNRDTIGKAYLQDVQAEVLNAMHEQMEREEFGDTWIRTAVEDDRIVPEAVQTVVKQRHGDKVAMWSSNTDANMRAAEAGYEIVNPRAMSPEERKHVREHAGVESANDLFGRGPSVESKKVTPDSFKLAFADWVQNLGQTCNLRVQVQFFSAPEATVMASCTANTSNPIVRFNVGRLNDAWFCHRGPEQLALVVHEFGHALCDRPMEHGPGWGEACCRIAGKLAGKWMGEGKDE